MARIGILTLLLMSYIAYHIFYASGQSQSVYWITTTSYVCIVTYVLLFDSIQKSTIWRNIYNIVILVIVAFVLIKFFPIFDLSDLTIGKLKELAITFSLYGVCLVYGSIIGLRFLAKVLDGIDVKNLKFSGDIYKIFAPIGEVLRSTAYLFKVVVSTAGSWVGVTTSNVGLSNNQNGLKVIDGKEVDLQLPDYDNTSNLIEFQEGYFASPEKLEKDYGKDWQAIVKGVK